jgi:hypothetical protein
MVVGLSYHSSILLVLTLETGEKWNRHRFQRAHAGAMLWTGAFAVWHWQWESLFSRSPLSRNLPRAAFWEAYTTKVTRPWLAP